MRILGAMGPSGRYSSSSILLVAAVSAVAAALAWSLWPLPSTAVRQTRALADNAPLRPAGPVPRPPPASTPSPVRFLPPAGAGTVPPPGVSAEQWRGLEREYATRPAELHRLEAYFRYADQLRRFRDSGPADGAGRAALARELDQGLNDRLARRELSADEARQIKIAVLDTLVADPKQRRTALAQWEASVRAGDTPDPAVAAREATFQTRQAAIVADWQATPPEQRDAQALQQRLEALRRSSFPLPR